MSHLLQPTSITEWRQLYKNRKLPCFVNARETSRSTRQHLYVYAPIYLTGVFTLRWEDGSSSKLTTAKISPMPNGDDFEEPLPGVQVIGSYRGTRYPATIEAVHLVQSQKENKQPVEVN